MARGPGEHSRGKIPIKKIEKQSNLNVSFSRRRSGLFKKATELSILCGCEIGIVIFSMMHKVYAFGNPSAEHVFNRFIQGDTDEKALEHHRHDDDDDDDDIRELYEETISQDEIVEKERTRADEAANEVTDNKDGKYWWRPQEGLTLESLKKMLVKLDEFQKALDSSDMQRVCGPSTVLETGQSPAGEISIALSSSSGEIHLGQPPNTDLALSSSGGTVRRSDKGKAPMW